MKLSTSFITLAMALVAPSALGAKVDMSSVKPGTSAPIEYLPGQYIIEMSSLSGLGGKRAYPGTPHQELYSALKKRNILFSVKKEYDITDIMVGASVQLTSQEDVARIARLPGVTNIRPVMMIPGPERLHNFVVDGPKDTRIPADGESTHVMTGVDKAHAQGITGKGIKIGIIDTGIDYNHPALGAGFGPGHKVVGGYDFVGDSYTGSNAAVPDNDPLDQCNGHGTHVAGIIAANPDNIYGISGVAYDSDIYSYRLFGCTGSVSDDIIVEALIRAYKDGMDVITLSLGGVAGWTETTSGVVASRIADSGRVVTIAAGNDGADGSWYASSPGTGQSVISVGSVDNTVIPIQTAHVVGVTHAPIPYLQALPMKVDGTLPVYATSTDVNVADDACAPLPASTPDLSKFVVVVRRGTCAFTDKLANIAAKGGKVMLIYNNGGSFSPITVGNYTAALISADDGAFLVNSFASKSGVSITFPQSGANYNLPSDTGGLMSDFSTFGPTFDMYFKPAVSAPGGNILSTLPLKLGGWGVESGTSMATPFTAGASALVLQAKGKGVAKDVQTLLQTTASNVHSNKDDSGPLQTLTQAGAGLIQVDRAINYQTTVTPGQFTLNDTSAFQSTKTFWIKNNSPHAQVYHVSHVPAGTAMTVQPGEPDASLGPVELQKAAATVHLSLHTVPLLAGASLPVIAHFSAPTGLDSNRLPVFSGFIQISGNNETLHVPYMGAAAALKDKAVLDTSDVYFGYKIPALMDGQGNLTKGMNSYTLQGTDAPTAVFRMSFGSPLVRVDLVASNTDVKPTIKKRSWFSWWWGGNDSNFGDVKVVGALAEYDYAPRNSEAATSADNGFNQYQMTSQFADNSLITKGEYKILIRALKVTGNPLKEEDFESWLSPAFRVDSSST